MSPCIGGLDDMVLNKLTHILTCILQNTANLLAQHPSWGHHLGAYQSSPERGCDVMAIQLHAGYRLLSTEQTGKCSQR